MKLRVYEGKDCFIVVPELFLPPADASAHAPFTLAGFVDEANLRMDELIAIRNGIESRFFAVVCEKTISAWPVTRYP